MRRGYQEICNHESLTTEGPAKTIIDFIKNDLNLILDPVEVKKRTLALRVQRREQLQREKAEREYRTTPKYRLELAKAALEAAKTRVADTEAKVKEAARIFVRAKQDLLVATSDVAKWQKETDRTRRNYVDVYVRD